MALFITCLNVVCISAQARAEEALERVSIDYSSVSCGSRDAFVSRVRSRTTKFELAPTAHDVRHFEVGITRRGESFVAELRIESSEGASNTRTVDGATCEMLLDAVALMTALAIDPTVPVTVQPPADDTTADPDAPPPEETPRPIPETATNASDFRQTDASGDAAAENKRRKRPVREEPAVRFGASGGFAFAGGVVEKALLGGRFGLDGQMKVTEILAPTLRIGAAYQRAARVEGEVGAAQFSLTSGKVEMCPVRFNLEGPFLRPCVNGTIGGLHGRGVDLPVTRSATQLYMAWGGSVRLSFPVHRLLTFEGNFGVEMPIRRDRFLIEEGVVSRAKAITSGGTAGLSVWFF